MIIQDPSVSTIDKVKASASIDIDHTAKAILSGYGNCVSHSEFFAYNLYEMIYANNRKVTSDFKIFENSLGYYEYFLVLRKPSLFRSIIVYDLTEVMYSKKPSWDMFYENVLRPILRDWQ